MGLASKVPFSRPNAKKCICWLCPVQRDSACMETNVRKMGEVLTTKFFEPEVMPGMYCSSGYASCQDIDVSRSCICQGCDVYGDFQLGKGQPTDHYCERGAAR